MIVVVLLPGFKFGTGIVQRQEPVFVQGLSTEAECAAGDSRIEHERPPVL